MRFWKQSALALGTGSALIAPLELLKWSWLPSDNLSMWHWWILYGLSVPWLGGIILCALGTLRIWGKLAYHTFGHGMPVLGQTKPTKVREVLGQNPLTAWVYWIDEDGKDRDGHA